MMRWIFLILIFAAGVLRGETVAWWRFEDNGDSQANPGTLSLEISPTGIFEDTELPGSQIVTDGATVENKRAFEPGSSEEGSSVPTSQILNDVFAYGSFTVEAFVRLNEADGIENEKHMRLLGASRDGERGGWSISISELKLVFGAQQGLATAKVGLVSTQSLEPGKWHHIAVVGYRSPDVLKIRLFLDGQECEVEKNFNCYPESPGGEAILPSENPLLISSRNRFRGLLDEVRISDAALQPEEFLRVESQTNSIP